MNEECPDPCSVSKELHDFRREMQDKYLHLRNSVEEVVNRQSIMHNDLEKLVGNGQPGSIAKMTDWMIRLQEQIAKLEVATASAAAARTAAEATRTEARNVMGIWLPVIAVLVAAVIGILGTMWATRSGRSSLGVSTTQIYARIRNELATY